ncbi:hypothetical protein [Pedobacter caeni]|uniref:Pentapeptide repeat-containing protein n=1 Tax=Pedobacter caeni TaxID=288992 RepID=A0A1M4V9D8_9SPHI|nr:hypothetical protein [Pedobacter caeni]SHE65507.1 hypothetical protein SAMN04488522_101825 [Pedobacter caeni]
MTNNPIDTISANEAKKNISSGIPLRNVFITGTLNIENGSEWDKEMIIENCIIENLVCISIQFNKQVTIKNTHIKAASFDFCYFIGGLIIDSCQFDEYLDFNAGGHNSKGNFIIINGNHFRGFVNFFDCWFNGEISVNNNLFESGTNILSKTLWVSFDVPIVAQNNIGDLSIESECKSENI